MATEQLANARISALDGIRGLAALSVILFHFYFAGAGTTLLGSLGVGTFFVLSGFLITGILLNCRKLCDEGQPVIPTVRRFYIRFLRIFPLFYFALFLAALLNLPGAREGFWWHATYTSNFYISIHRNMLGATGHFWSLAVEEQFYLVWPWIVMSCNKKRLLQVILAVILIGIFFRIAAQHVPIIHGVLPFACLDELGIGALLALISDLRMARPLSILRLLGVAVGLPLLAIVMFFAYVQRFGEFVSVLTNTAVALVGAALILSCSNPLGKTGRILSFPPLAYLGTVSYGLYVYHVPIWYLLKFDYFVHSLHRTGIALVVTVGVAAISWHFFESPINSMKQHFSYRVVPQVVEKAT
jgi:peptidoglycan/LPS O-acetylase OafA/YrhL